MTESERRLGAQIEAQIEASCRMTEAWRRLVKEGCFKRYQSMSTGEVNSMRGGLGGGKNIGNGDGPIRDYFAALEDYLKP